MYLDWQYLWSLHQLFKYPEVKCCCYLIVSQHHKHDLCRHHQPSWWISSTSSYKSSPWSWSRSPRMTIPWSLSSSSCSSINVTYDDNGDQKESSSNTSSHHGQHGILQDSIWGEFRWFLGEHAIGSFFSPTCGAIGHPLTICWSIGR